MDWLRLLSKRLICVHETTDAELRIMKGCVRFEKSGTENVYITMSLRLRRSCKPPASLFSDRKCKVHTRAAEKSEPLLSARRLRNQPLGRASHPRLRRRRLPKTI